MGMAENIPTLGAEVAFSCSSCKVQMNVSMSVIHAPVWLQGAKQATPSPPRRRPASPPTVPKLLAALKDLAPNSEAAESLPRKLLVHVPLMDGPTVSHWAGDSFLVRVDGLIGFMCFSAFPGPGPRSKVTG